MYTQSHLNFSFTPSLPQLNRRVFIFFWLTLLLLATTSKALAAIVFINEFHYDNTGSDVDEGVEIAGTAGFDLQNWSLQFYNGSDGSVYKTLALAGIIADEQGGFGALSFSVSGVQNGPADGIALISALGETSEFISYEGTITATEGAAATLTSIDIGISEGSATPSGHSLQRIGSGASPTEFLWTVDTSSFGQLNNNQTISSINTPLPSALLLLSSSLLGGWGLRRIHTSSAQQSSVLKRINTRTGNSWRIN